MSRHILLGASANLHSSVDTTILARGRELVLMVELRGSAGLPRMAAIGAELPICLRPADGSSWRKIEVDDVFQTRPQQAALPIVPWLCHPRPPTLMTRRAMP